MAPVLGEQRVHEEYGGRREETGGRVLSCTRTRTVGVGAEPGHGPCQEREPSGCGCAASAAAWQGGYLKSPWIQAIRRGRVVHLSAAM